MTSARPDIEAPQIEIPRIEISEALIRRFDSLGPRYTSYPTADRFHDKFDEQRYIKYLQQPSSAPLSIYVHLPFCASICYYCGCNKIITKDHGRSAKYLRYLDKEMALVASRLQGKRQVVQLHLGGGTPTFLSTNELHELMDMLRKHFDFAADAELGIEIDPRTVNDTNCGGARSRTTSRVASPEIKGARHAASRQSQGVAKHSADWAKLQQQHFI